MAKKNEMESRRDRLAAQLMAAAYMTERPSTFSTVAWESGARQLAQTAVKLADILIEELDREES